MSSRAPRILVVADVPPADDLLAEIRSDVSLDCASVTGVAQANKALAQEHFDVLLVDLSTPDPARTALLEHARRVSPDCRIILVSSDSGHHEIARAFALGAADMLQGPIATEDLLGAISRATAAGAGREPPHLHGADPKPQRKATSLEAIHALVSAVEAKDPYTKQHSRQVTHYATQLARQLNVREDIVESVAVAAIVHDVGKIGVPDHILVKPCNLSEQEFESIRRHPALGEQIVRNLSAFNAEAKIIRHHHENWDGSGYPDALAGEDIPLGSRLIRIADSMDAMLMARSYKEAFPVDVMLHELTQGSGRDFDPELATMAGEWCRVHPRELILPPEDTRLGLSRSA